MMKNNHGPQRLQRRRSNRLRWQQHQRLKLRHRLREQRLSVLKHFHEREVPAE